MSLIGLFPAPTHGEVPKMLPHSLSEHSFHYDVFPPLAMAELRDEAFIRSVFLCTPPVRPVLAPSASLKVRLASVSDSRSLDLASAEPGCEELLSSVEPLNEDRPADAAISR